MTFSGQSDSADSQNSACDLANYVLVDRESLAQVKSIIWELAEQLVTLERAAYNIEACEIYWEAQLPDEQILDRVEYFHSRFWDELPKGGLGGLNHQVVDLSRVLRILTDFAIAGEGDK
jgi:predicted ATPase